MTYGQIAEILGNPRMSRQVGWALHANKSSEIPCHRVVNREGRLAPNFNGEQEGRTIAFATLRPRLRGALSKALATESDGEAEQRRRLEAEGVTFKGALVDLSTHLWPN